MSRSDGELGGVGDDSDADDGQPLPKVAKKDDDINSSGIPSSSDLTCTCCVITSKDQDPVEMRKKDGNSSHQVHKLARKSIQRKVPKRKLRKVPKNTPEKVPRQKVRRDRRTSAESSSELIDDVKELSSTSTHTTLGHSK